MKDLTDPTNRDTVPAMLTPGEFVLNKEASTMYADIIEQMNNHGLQQRHQENMNRGGMVPSYNEGGLVSFLKEHEGYRDEAYQDQAGVWTIGYGRTRNPDGSPIKPGQKTKQKEEDSWLNTRAAKDRSATEAYGKKHGYDWNDNQIDALSSFRYNIGNLDQLTDNGTRGMEEITQMLPAYNKAGGQVSKGLQNRRNAELDLFQGAGGQPAVPGIQAAPPSVQETRRPLQFAAAAQDRQAANQQPSFGDAFAAARAEQGAGGTFEHNGQQFTTDRADDINVNMGGYIPSPQELNIGGWLKNLVSPNLERQAELSGIGNKIANFDAAQATTGGFGGNPVINNPTGGAAPTTSSIATAKGGQANLAVPESNFVPQAQPGQQVQGGFGGNPVIDFPPQVPSGPYDGMTSQQLNEATGQSYADAQESIPGGPNRRRGFAPLPIPEAQPIPGSDEALLQSSSQEAEVSAELPPGHPERIAAVQAGQIVPTPEDIAINQEYQYASRAGIPQAVDERSAEIAAANADGSGRINQEPMNFAAAAENRDVSGRINEEPMNFAGVDPNQVPPQEVIPGPAVNEDYQYASRAGTPEVVEERSAEIAAANEDGSGRINEEPMNFAAASEKRDVSQVGAGHHPDGNAMNFKKAAEARSAGMSDAKGAAATLAAKPPSETGLTKENQETTKLGVTEITDKLGPAIDEASAATAEEAGKTATPDKIEKAKGFIKENFGDLFDKKELARAALIYAGALATGLSPQGALAYAGKGYINRIDGKEAMRIKSEAEAAKAQAAGKATIDMTKPEQYVVDGKRVNTFVMKKTDAAGNQVNTRVLADGSPVPAASHQNFDTVPGTPEYSKRVQAESKDYATNFKELQSRFGEFKGKDGATSYATDLTPSKVGSNTAKWAIKNGVPPEAVGQVLDNAYAAARNDASLGNKPKNIEAYLNSEYIQTKTGSGALFQGAEPTQVNSLISSLTNASGKDSTTVLQFGRSKWNELGPEGQKRYQARAAEGTTPFMGFMQDIISGEI